MLNGQVERRKTLVLAKKRGVFIMIKSIFFNIIKDPLQRDDLNFLKDKHKIYGLFCKNGYKKDFDSFEKELNEFLGSDEVKRVLDGEYFELSDEMLEMVSGGFALRKFVVGGVISLMAVSTSAFALPNDFESLKTGQTHISRRLRDGGSGGGNSIGSSIFGKKRKSEDDDNVEGGENQKENDHEIIKSVMNELQGVVKKIARIRAQEKNLRKNRQKDDNDLKKLVNDELEESLEKFAKIRSKEQKSKKNPQRSGNCFESVI